MLYRDMTEAPTAFVAIDQPLVNGLHRELRDVTTQLGVRQILTRPRRETLDWLLRQLRGQRRAQRFSEFRYPDDAPWSRGFRQGRQSASERAAEIVLFERFGKYPIRRPHDDEDAEVAFPPGYYPYTQYLLEQESKAVEEADEIGAVPI